MRVALLGFGLIGGSIARALHGDRDGGWAVAAWTPNGMAPRVAADAGIIELAAPSPAAALGGADLVVLAAPPLACLDLVHELGGALRGSLSPDAVVTDVASTKGAIGAAASQEGLRFVGGHPMAGREATGFEAADAGLFRGRPWVVVAPDGDALRHDAVARVEALAAGCGARPVRMSAPEHDHAVAAISHLPLVLAAALVEAVAGTEGDLHDDWRAAAALAAGGWDGMTRLARGDVEMGTGIAATNAPEIADRVRKLRDVLDGWLADLERGGGPDVDALRGRLTSARDVLTDEA